MLDDITRRDFMELVGRGSLATLASDGIHPLTVLNAEQNQISLLWDNSGHIR